MTSTFGKAAGTATFIAALALGAMVGAGGATPAHALTDALLTISPILAAVLSILAAVLLTRPRTIARTAANRRVLADLELQAERLDH